MSSRPPTHFQPAKLLVGLGVLALTIAGHGQTLPIGPEPDEEDSDDGALPAMEMLVEGSILQKVIIPQYDDKLRLSSVLRADRLTLINKKTIEATKARIEFFKEDQTLRGTIDLESATLHNQKFLRSSDPVELVSEDMNTKGTALVYDLELSRGFLYGPTQTDIFLETKTAMNHPSTPTLGLAGATMMAAAALHAAEIPAFTPEQLKGLDRLAESRADDFLIKTEANEKMIAAVEEESAKADQTLEEFLEEAAIKIPKGKPVDLTTEVPGPEDEPPFKVPASIRAKDGFYFDSEAGIIVFLNEVEVDHPEFTLTGADEVKVFMEKEPVKPLPKAPKPRPDASDAQPTQPATEGQPQPDSADSIPNAQNTPPNESASNPAGGESNTGEAKPLKPDPAKKASKEDDVFGGAEFGDPSRIVATGAVVVTRKTPNPGDKKAKASGREMVMDLKTDDLIIRGGQPWILSDTANGRVVDPNGYIRINLKTGDASFVGDARGFVEMDKPKANDKPKP